MSIPVLYSSQNRLTQSRYYYGTGDGNGHIYYIKAESGKNWDIFRMNEDGTGIIQITDDTLYKYMLGDISADKSKIAMIKKDDNYDYIYTMNFDGTNAKQVYSTPNGIGQVKISPNNNKIAFIVKESTTNNSGTLYTMNFDGSGIRTLRYGDVSIYPQKIASDISIQSNNYFSFDGSTMTKDMVNNDLSVAFSTDSTQISFIKYSVNHLFKINIDGTNLIEVSTFTVYGNYYWLTSGKFLFTMNTYDTVNLYRLVTVNPDGTNLNVLFSTPAFSFSDFRLSPDETKIAANVYLGNNKYKFVIISLSGTIYSEIPTDIYASPSWVSESKFMYNISGDIFIVNADGTGINQLTNDAIQPSYLISAEGNTILYYSYRSGSNLRKIFSMDTNGLNKKLLLDETTTQSIGYTFVLSPDGTKMLYSYKGDTPYYELLSVNTDGSGTSVVIDSGSSNSYAGFSWDPTGTKVLYDYYIIDSDGKNKNNNYFPQLMITGSFVFSPDGTKVAFLGESNDYSKYYLCTAPVDFSTYTVILTSGSGNCYPKDWKADKIIFSMDNGNKIYSINSNGSEMNWVDDVGYYFSYAPKFSSDGNSLAYRKTGNLFYINNVTGTNQKNLSNYTVYFDWSLDGSKIAYQYSTRQNGIPKIYLADSAGSNAYNLNQGLKYGAYSVFPVNNSKFVYSGDMDIWVGDYNTSVATPIDVIIPPAEQANEIKVVVPDGGGYRGTYNPDLGKPVTIGFRGTSAGNYTLRIFTLLGEQVYTETKSITSAEGWFEWLPKDIASGVYVVYVNGPGVKIQKKIAILR